MHCLLILFILGLIAIAVGAILHLLAAAVTIVIAIMVVSWLARSDDAMTR